MYTAVVILAVLFTAVLVLAGVLAFVLWRERRDPRTRASRAPVACDLVILNGPRVGARYRMGASLSIGAAADNTVALSDTGVSTRHALIRAESGRFVLEDLKSQNGIWSHGRRVHVSTLEAGAQFQIGTTVFGVVRSGEPAPQAADHLTKRRAGLPAEESFALQSVGFERLQQIGFGGQVTVFRARGKTDGAELVVKYLNDLPHDDSRDYVFQKFKQQIIIGMSIRHPHCVRILGGDPRASTPYLIEEFVPGGTLRDRIEKGRLPFEECVRIVGQMCDALHYLHGRGLIHRDIKPSNILFDADGAVKLTDFGLIRIVGSPRVTRMGMCLGTPHYMSVEQVRGESSRITPASDLYSLGVVAFELFTGKLPFEGASDAIMAQHLQAPPPLASALDPRIPERIARAIAQALEKEPARRFPDARAMALAFGYSEPFQRGEVLEHDGKPGKPLRLRVTASGKDITIRSSPAMLTRALINPSDKLISREHGQVFARDGLWRAGELAHKPTANGLFVNGVRVDEEGDVLEPGDELRLGHTTLRVIE